jgi:hypothetical protein
MSLTFRVAAAGFALSLGIAGAACRAGGVLVLNELVEARSLTGEIRADFLKANDKSGEAVMADTDEHSITAAHEAQDAHSRIAAHVERLQTVLGSLSYANEIRLLEAFTQRYGEYKTLDDTILELAIENSNIKAQRLLFGPQTDAVHAIRAALDAAVADTPARSADRARGLSSGVMAGLFEIQAIEARHIAESDEAKMTEMEMRMSTLRAGIARDIEELRRLLPQTAVPTLEPIESAMRTFEAARDELIPMSRRNTNVRSLALTLGKKRTLAAQCEDALAALTDSLPKHQLTGTR